MTEDPGLFSQLLVEPGVIERSDRRDGISGRIGLMAYHGGSLEVGTDTIAAAVADRAGASLYTVIQPLDLTWHIPSKLIDPAQSPTLSAFLAHVDTVVTVHGYGRPDRFTSVLLGGRHRAMASHVAMHLRRSLPQYEIVDDLSDIPRELQGQHEDNPVNRPRNAGVQIELPPRIRGQGPFWADHPRDLPVPHTEALVAGLAEAVASWTTH